MPEYRVQKYSPTKYAIFVMNMGFYIYYTLAYNLSDTFSDIRFRLLLAYISIGYFLLAHKIIYIIQWNNMVGYEFPNSLDFQHWKRQLGLNKYLPLSNFLLTFKFGISIAIVKYNWDNLVTNQYKDAAEFALYIHNIITLIQSAIIALVILCLMAACCLLLIFPQINLRRKIREYIPIDIPINNRVAEDVCSICLDNPQNSTWIELPACKHSFHQDCMNTYLRHPNSSGTCPLCRTAIITVSVV